MDLQFTNVTDEETDRQIANLSMLRFHIMLILIRFQRIWFQRITISPKMSRALYWHRYLRSTFKNFPIALF